MYENKKEPMITAPVPGMGMTHEVGARPWQQPAQYTTVDDVAKFYIGQMQGDSFAEQTANILETKMPVTMIANAMQTTNVMNGVHSIDIGIMTLPIIMEMIMLVGDSARIDYVTGLERNLDEEVADSAMAAAVSRIEDAQLKSQPKDEDDDTEPMMEEPDMEMEDEPQDVPTGLMTRRVS